MSERVALATLAIGERYERRWRRVAEPLWRAYSESHDYDLVCLTEPLDTSERAASRSPAWQKCLILEDARLAGYDRVVWVDADVAIRPDAPPIVAGVPPQLIGAVDEYSSPTPELHRHLLAKLYAHWDATGVAYVDNLTPADYYRAWDLPPRDDGVVQTGVMVLSPDHHAEILRRVYDAYEDRGKILNYEMRPLSWELLEAGMVHWIDPAFNCIWGSMKARSYPFLSNAPDHPDAPAAARRGLGEVNFMHFAGDVDEMELVAGWKPAEPRRLSGAPGGVSSPTTRAAVAMAVFRRPDLTAEVLETVRRARPERLFVFADAPRPDVPADVEDCAAARAVIATVDWPCEVATDFATEHLGARMRMSTGLDWVFGQAEEAIVLEDDCVPDPSFFGYCDELLARYRDDERVWSISGNDFRFRDAPPVTDYVFSRYPLIWGWATWARAWRHFDPDIAAWEELRDTDWLLRTLGDPMAATYWGHMLDQVRDGLDAWDYGWVLASWIGGGLTAVPTTNLVSNLGFRPDATHTKADAANLSPFAAMPTAPVAQPLRHPAAVERDAGNDRFIEDVVFSGNLGRMMARVRAAHRAREAVAR